ncbi:glutamate-1-semialdehyde 2,1-aminomutase [Sphingobacterium allocomposti]|uniref:Glutamate-1-semialdehyde 2,1-aminomutase n=1 Tax=Sphingobacterium allocomposti TaxID=415956 RepID=A0A5S5D7U9_9SPHI|nr:glutamate-1-semialdehyde 2,1-aminomutase [Sphingobacterium composti Yoo et al. 2007 non Ten et al. 2007]TYP91554.1 glutamate-1-semialdehyde 2,1-aminomutase [Sphingobacterium composti Yoo et al. 2007 non Ten et al. 2007]HLS94160.1 glutamate-1-semialdehyde 2,1-aminomutase [Sphingobacterium sp.]
MTKLKDISRKKSAELFEKAKNFFPGGVNSPVRAFKSVYGTPLFIERGDKARIWDADGNEFIDYCCSWGPLILGHNNDEVREAVAGQLSKGLSFGAPTRLENELAELILNRNKFIEKIRFVSSGTEAVMSAIRLARGYTRRDKIVKFEGCYHGHSDSLLVKAGSGLVTFGETSSAGVPQAFAQETIVVSLNDREAIQEVFTAFPEQIAAVIIEGVPANNGLLIQDHEYIHFLREITKKHGALLIFDEVITGFRLGFEGAARHYNVQPDIITYGKIIGGGMPVGAYGASKELMSHISPDGNVYQAGTLSGNPVAMAAGIAALNILSRAGFYEKQEEKTRSFVEALRAYIRAKGYEVQIFTIGSIFWFAFTSQLHIKRADEIDPQSMEKYKVMHRALLNQGIYFGPSGYEVGFISDAHSESDLEVTLQAIKVALDVVFN